MRLIDADVLGQVLLKIRERETGTPLVMVDWFHSIVRDSPTAYDVEAVVRELENEKFVFYASDDHEASGYNDGLNEAIRIVKRGGRNE